jgi:3-deoxy-D-manno-octulosonate cytidylyltransferase
MIKVLDCTLRDGGYINNWKFPQNQIIQILSSLDKANVDIVELGYINDKLPYDINSTIFDSIENIDRYYKSLLNNRQLVVMMNLFEFDLDNLPIRKDSIVSGIRLAFHKKNIDDALLVANKIIGLGYDLYFQPMVTKSYSDNDFISLINKVNNIDCFAFYVVDSFGSMSLESFSHFINIADDNLNESISLGYHSHNNMQLAFSNAISFCNKNFTRNILLDSSIYGMGRGAGNLNTELILDYLNSNKAGNYYITPILESIDEILSNYRKVKSWGFSPAQYLSASIDCHPNYTSYLINKKTNHISSVSKILNKIPQKDKSSFKPELIEKLYEEYQIIGNSEPKGKLNFLNDKEVMLIAPGASIIANLERIKSEVNSDKFTVIALNHMPVFDCEYYFFSNQQRFDKFKNLIDFTKLVITSNIETSKKANVVLDIQEIGYIEGKFVDNVAMLMINYLIKLKVKYLSIAGLDGYIIGEQSYAYNETTLLSNETNVKELNDIIRFSLKHLKKTIAIEIITESIFSNDVAIKILGVIPARYDSTRFQGKPLCLIDGIPMIKRTYNQVIKSSLLDRVVVATDSDQIKDYCDQEGIPVVMTSKNCLTGTDRLAEVSNSEKYDFYINIQGDEPVIEPETINQISSDFRKHHGKYHVYNLYKKIKSKDEVNSSSIIKAIVNENDELIYMSRLKVPFNKSSEKISYIKQVCVYGFTRKALKVFSENKKTINEKYEDIEILRFIDLGYKVKMQETKYDSIAVDLPEDVKKVEIFLKKHNT